MITLCVKVEIGGLTNKKRIDRYMREAIDRYIKKRRLIRRRKKYVFLNEYSMIHKMAIRGLYCYISDGETDIDYESLKRKCKTQRGNGFPVQSGEPARLYGFRNDKSKSAS